MSKPRRIVEWISCHQFGTFIQGRYTVTHNAEYEYVCDEFGPVYSTSKSRLVEIAEVEKRS